MKHSVFAAAAAFALLATPAFADSKPSDEEAKKLIEAAAALGFSGGTLEKETEDGGQYDLKFHKDFKLLSITRD